MVNEPSVLDTIQILRGIAEKYASFHGVRISDRALVAAAELSTRYIQGRFCEFHIPFLAPIVARIPLCRCHTYQSCVSLPTQGLSSLLSAREQALLWRFRPCSASATPASDRACDAAVPDKAIDLVDEACANVRVQLDSVPEDIDVLRRQKYRLEVEDKAISKEKDKACLLLQTA